MRILVVRLSSLGDVIHTLPALTDAVHHYPEIEFDWVIESTFAEVPTWHKHVARTLPISLRQWRKRWYRPTIWKALAAFKHELNQQRYELIIDAQGLIKSSIIASWADGTRVGLDWNSAREGVASWFYHHTFDIAKMHPSVARMRMLFAQALSYKLPHTLPQYGINLPTEKLHHTNEKYLVFLHGTSWENKAWPVVHWLTLADIAVNAGYQIKLVWGNIDEQQRAQYIAQMHTAITVAPRLSLTEIAHLLTNASGVISVDTGLGHLAAALHTPTVFLYGPSVAFLTALPVPHTRIFTSSQACAPCIQRQCRYVSHTDAPCMNSLSPEAVWSHFLTINAHHHDYATV